MATNSNLESNYPVKYITTQPLNAEGGYDGSERHTYPVGAEAEYVDVKDYVKRVEDSNAIINSDYNTISLQTWIDEAYKRLEVEGRDIDSLTLQDWLDNAKENIDVEGKVTNLTLQDWLNDAKTNVMVIPFSVNETTNTLEKGSVISLQDWLEDAENKIMINDENNSNVDKKCSLAVWIDKAEDKIKVLGVTSNEPGATRDENLHSLQIWILSADSRIKALRDITGSGKWEDEYPELKNINNLTEAIAVNYDRTTTLIEAEVNRAKKAEENNAKLIGEEKSRAQREEGLLQSSVDSLVQKTNQLIQNSGTLSTDLSSLQQKVNNMDVTTGGQATAISNLQETVGDSTSGLVKDVNSLKDLSNIYAKTSLNLGRDSNSTKGNYSSTLGSANIASGNYSHAEGVQTKAKSIGVHTEGYNVVVEAQYSHGEGYNNSLTDNLSQGSSHIEGFGNTADLDGSGVAWHIEGYSNLMQDDAGDSSNQEDGRGPHIEGCNNISNSRHGSHGEGYYTHVNGVGAHAEGYGSENQRVTAIGQGAHAEGYQCTANGQGAHASGYKSVAKGQGAHAMGYQCQTGTNRKQVVVGRSNAIRESDDCYFIVGANRIGSTYGFENGLEVWQDRVEGLTYTTQGKDYAEYIYPYEGRVEENMKYFVTIKNQKIKKASYGDYIVGITSQEPSVIGGYMQERESSDFWCPIGMLGVLNVYDDGTCKVNEFCKCGKNGIATYASEYGLQTYYVIERVSENEIKVILK